MNTLIQNWRVHWSYADDGSPVLAVWSETTTTGDVSRLICKITPKVSMTRDDLANAALIASAPAMQRVLERLIFLQSGAQEEAEASQPTLGDWFAAVDEAVIVLESSKTLPI